MNFWKETRPTTVSDPTGIPRRRLIQGEHDKTVAHKFLETVFGVRQKVLDQDKKKEYTAGLPGIPLIERKSSVNNGINISKRSFTK